MIGQSATRLEDARLTAGRGNFHDSIAPAGTLHLRVVRSSRPHGRIIHIDTSGAECADGVVAVWTAADLPSDMAIPSRQPTPGLDFTRYLQRPLAVDWVRYVGEPVAVVVATDPYRAEDAANLVQVTVQDAPPLLDAYAAGDTKVVSLGGAPARVGTVESGYGDAEASFARADHIVELDLDTGRHSGMPLEPRGLTAQWDPNNQTLTVWGATKVPFWNRSMIARFLGLSDAQIHLAPSDVGGSFGIRGELYPEDLLTPWASKTLGGTVQWVEDRAEHCVAANHARQQRHHVRAGFTKDGVLLGLDDEAWLDTGAYIRTHGAVVASLTAGMFAGPYRVPAFRSRVHVIVTNKTGVGTYRAPGRFQNNFVREQVFDVAATQLGISPDDIRTRNLLDSTELPGERPMRIFGAPMALDGADHRGHYEQAAAEVDLTGWRASADQARRTGRLVGVASAPILEKAGLGFENAFVSVDGSGAVRVAVGSTNVGQGAQTAMAQIAAEALPVDLDKVHVVLSDTATLSDGGGTFASRSTVMGGTAVYRAALKAAARARHVAATIWGVDDDSVVLAGGYAVERGTLAHTIPLGQLATLATTPKFIRDGTEPGLVGRDTFSAPTMTYPYGAHFAMVEVDPQTADVRVLRYAVSYEIGRAVNPQMARGQVEGGVAQGIGGALFEELPYDPEGIPQATGLASYRLPTVLDVPPIQVLLREEAPTTISPLGVRGVGEAGIAGAGAAIAGAVRDALQLDGPIPRLPLTPATVRQLMSDARPR